MTMLTQADTPPSQVGAALGALRVKGATGMELAAFAQILRSQASSVESGIEGLLDTCGTGGGAPSFNVSTAAAFIAAAAGARVAKHGNRGVTSGCGSADVLEALGAKVTGTAAQFSRVLDRVGLAFLFAPEHHPGMRHVGPARRELGFRTVFNQLGPLVNPANARRQLVGVYDSSLLRPMGEALLELGAERAVVVHSEDGLDEVSPCAPTRYAMVWDGCLTEGVWTPDEFDIPAIPSYALLPGATPTENAHILREAISEASSVRSKAVIPSSACAIWLAGAAPDLKSAARSAMDAVREGRALKKLLDFVSATNNV